jgi:hypothetical protein
MPGFTAEASLCKDEDRYRIAVNTGLPQSDQSVSPQILAHILAWILVDLLNESKAY